MIQPLYTSGVTGGNPVTPLLIGSWVFHSQSASSPMPVAGTLNNWHVVLKTAPTVGNTKTLTVYKNNVATALTVTANAGDTDLSDLTHSVTVAAGDLIDVRQSNTGADTASDFASALEWTPDDGVSSVHGYAAWNPRWGTTVAYDGALFGGFIDATEADESSYVGSAGTITKHYVNLNTAPGAGQSRTFVLMKNGTAQDGTGGTPDTTVTISDAATTGSASFSLTIAAGDLVSVRMTPSAAPAATGGAGGLAFEPTTAGQIPIGMDAEISNAPGTHYSHVTGSYSQLPDWSATETDKQNIAGETEVYLYGLAVWLDAAPGSGKSRQFTLRINGESTAQRVILSGATTTAVCTGTAVHVGPGDLIGLQEIVTGTAAGSIAKVTFYLLGGEPVRGSLVAGVNTTVKATRAIAFGLDGATNVHDTPGEFKVFGDFEVTGTSTIPGYATTSYVDTADANVAKRTRVRAATTTGITIATALNNGDTIDGVTLATGDLVLVKDQGSPAEENGIYVVGPSPARFSQYDTYDEHPGSLIAVCEGTANADTLWLCTSDPGGTLNTDPINFTQFTGGGATTLTRMLTAIIGDGVNAITTGVAGFCSCPVTATITKVRLLSSDPAVTSGSIVLDIWKDVFANYPPTVLDSITGSPKPGLSSETSAEDTSLNGTGVTAGDVLGFNVDSVTSLKRVTVEIFLEETL